MHSGESTASKQFTSVPRPKPQRWSTNRPKPIQNNWSRQSIPPGIARAFLTNRTFAESINWKGTKSMKTHLTAVLAGGLLYVPFAIGAQNPTAVTTDRVSVFKAPLVCPAAPQIGCGSASKPILLDLERQPGVLEAWLNRAGTIIAVVWKPESDAETRSQVATGLKEDRATELQGDSRDKTVQDFLSGKGWYHGADVDRLSEEEADIIAARLVRWVQAKSSLPKDKAEGLQRAFAESLRKDLTGEYARLNQKPRRLQDIARDYLDAEQIKVLKEAIKDEDAIEGGEKPVPKEG